MSEVEECQALSPIMFGIICQKPLNHEEHHTSIDALGTQYHWYSEGGDLEEPVPNALAVAAAQAIHRARRTATVRWLPWDQLADWAQERYLIEATAAIKAVRRYDEAHHG